MDHVTRGVLAQRRCVLSVSHYFPRAPPYRRVSAQDISIWEERWKEARHDSPS